ncbi:hypothetical protein ACFL6S_23925 [Candidatus Poribacteria bacterium]
MNFLFVSISMLSLANALFAASPAESSEAPHGSEILVGWASTSITPEKPVALTGQHRVRISKYVNDPVTATVLAIESKDGESAKDQAIMVSCDLVAIRKGIQDKIREHVKPRLPGFDIKKLLLNATHTHTGPTLVEGQYPPQSAEVITPTEYVDFMAERISDAIVEAWESRKPAGLSWAFGHAVVGHNRRAVYFDGSAKMYGVTNTEDFKYIEGYQDHSVDMLFFWDKEQKLKGLVINIACPSQVTEHESYVSADFWYEVRIELRKRYSEDLFIFPQCSAAGDQSPHFLLSKRSEESMRKRKGVSEREEIGLRVANAVDYAFPVARNDIQKSVVFKHVVKDINLPARLATKAEADSAKADYDRLMAIPESKRTDRDFIHLRHSRTIMKRYENQGEHPLYPMELHVIRLGDIAIATNPFELYLDYGLRIEARSKAMQTFLVQLACDSGLYLPTDKAIEGGSYSATILTTPVGPEGGQELVDRTVETISEIWGGKAE